MSEHTPDPFSADPDPIEDSKHPAHTGNGKTGEASYRTQSVLQSTADGGANGFELGVISTDAEERPNNIATVVVSEAGRRRFLRDTYVGIHDTEQDIEFLGRIVAGPWHPSSVAGAPEAIHGGNDFDVHGIVEILGQMGEDDRLHTTPSRPRPSSSVYIFPDDRLRLFLGTGGDFLIGHLVGNKRLHVAADSDSKNFLPRNVGVFGTVGSGKSNTAQVLMEEAIKAGWAVVVVDVEGEYVRMDEPSADPRMIELLAEQYGIQPKGVPDFRVYHPTSGTSNAADPRPFKVPISALDPDIVVDILEFSEAEMRVFGMASRQAALYAPAEAREDESIRPYNLQNLIDGLMETRGGGGNSIRLLPLSNKDDILTAGVVRSKLQHLGNSNILDWNKTTDVPELPIIDLLQAGRLTVLDVSETDDRSRNLAIAFVLQALFNRVIETARGDAMENGVPRPPVLVVIEEVHTFVSRAAAAKMKALLDNLQVISRRGRKRWMALALVSQQPNHVPDEMFELANTRFIHQIKSMTNLQPVKETTGSVDENLWTTVPAIEPGRCLLAGAAFKTPLFMDVRPARSRRMLVA